jgi:hypothetical protein
MNFSTFGPFPMSEWSQEGLKTFWDKTDTVQKRLDYPTGLNKAIGVYIVALEGVGGALIPWYVGKTDNGFGIRFKQHLRGARFASLFSKNSPAVKVFLIARVTSSAKLKRVTRKMREGKGMKSIDRLEFALIGSCLARNPDLVNKREKKFHGGLHVPGYWNSNPKNYDLAARKLAKMLKA